MKGEKSNQEEAKRSAEDWVSVARNFGEECVKIQHDPKLSIDQKLEKQKVLSNKMTKEIEADPHLSADDKRQMIDSIHNYMDEWKIMHDLGQQDEGKEGASKKKK